MITYVLYILCLFYTLVSPRLFMQIKKNESYGRSSHLVIADTTIILILVLFIYSIAKCNIFEHMLVLI